MPTNTLNTPVDRLSERMTDVRAWLIDLLLVLSPTVVITVSGKPFTEEKFELHIWTKPFNGDHDINFHPNCSRATTHRSLNREVKARSVATAFDTNRDDLIAAAKAAGWTVETGEYEYFTKLRHPEACK